MKIGDIVGVGAQNDSCLACDRCKHGLEAYCDDGQVGTYAGVYKRGAGKGDKSFGGYADYHRAPGHFVFKIPDGLDPALAAPMMCGGTTVYSPLKQYGAGTEGVKNVGIVGIGGLVSLDLLGAAAIKSWLTRTSRHFRDTSACSSPRPSGPRASSQSATVTTRRMRRASLALPSSSRLATGVTRCSSRTAALSTSSSRPPIKEKNSRSPVTSLSSVPEGTSSWLERLRPTSLASLPSCCS